MAISALSTTTATQNGKKIGTAIGLGTGAAYIMKNGKDLFLQSGKEAAEVLGNKNKGIAIAVAVSTGIIAGLGIVGRLVGSVIGKVIDKKNSTQQTK